MIELQQRPDDTPVCPHCEARLTRISFRMISKWMGKRYVYFCPECKKVLGVSHRKGFWMG